MKQSRSAFSVNGRIAAVLLSLAGSVPLFAADWIGYGGPADGGNAVAGPALVDDLAKAKLAWQSDVPIPDGRAADGSDKAASHTTIAGGYSSPLIAGNLAIVTYYVPAGETVCANALKSTGTPAPDEVDPKAAWKALELNGKEPVGYGKFLIEADDVVHAFDLATGKTVWKFVAPKGGVNFCQFNKGGTGATAVIGDGRVYALGTAGKVYGIDLKTGKLIWTGSIGNRAVKQEELRQRALKNGELLSFNRDFNGWLAFADGVVALNTNEKFKLNTKEFFYEVENGITALDAATGKTLWTAPKIMPGKVNGPLAWHAKTGGRFLAVADGEPGVTCLDAKTGAVLWTSPLACKPSLAPVCVGDVLLAVPAVKKAGKDGVERLSPGNSSFAAYALSDSGMTQRWALPESSGPALCAAVDGSTAWLLTRNAKNTCQLIAVEWASGKVLGQLETPFEANQEHANLFIAIGGDRIFLVDSKNSGNVKIAAISKNPQQPALLPGRLSAPGGESLAGGYCASIVPALDGAGHLLTRSRIRLLCFDLRP